jgi:hypothetical protein
MYAPKKEDVCENIEHKNHEYREEIYAGEEGRPLRMCGPWIWCSPPKEVARSPSDDAALRMLVALSPWAAARRFAMDPPSSKDERR